MVKKTKYTTLINKINSITRFFIFFSFIFILKEYSSIFNDKINFHQFAMVMFLIAVSFLLYKSVIIDKNFSFNNHAYSFWDSVIYFISFFTLLLYGYNLDYRFLVSGILILIIGRLLSVYITYKPLKTKYKF